MAIQHNAPRRATTVATIWARALRGVTSRGGPTRPIPLRRAPLRSNSSGIDVVVLRRALDANSPFSQFEQHQRLCAGECSHRVHERAPCLRVATWCVSLGAMAARWPTRNNTRNRTSAPSTPKLMRPPTHSPPTQSPPVADYPPYITSAAKTTSTGAENPADTMAAACQHPRVATNRTQRKNRRMQKEWGWVRRKAAGHKTFAQGSAGHPPQAKAASSPHRNTSTTACPSDSPACVTAEGKRANKQERGRFCAMPVRFSTPTSTPSAPATGQRQPDKHQPASTALFSPTGHRGGALGWRSGACRSGLPLSAALQRVRDVRSSHL